MREVSIPGLIRRSTCSWRGALVLALTAASLSACAKKQEPTSNSALLDEISGDEYDDDFVTADGAGRHEDQGTAVSAEAQLAVQDAIQEVYIVDFERCLEIEMDRLNNRYVAGDFTVELSIGTDGRVSKVNFIKWDIQERRTVEGASPRKADEFPGCLEQAAKEWQFDPPPERAYVHTYAGRVGEAWLAEPQANVPFKGPLIRC